MKHITHNIIIFLGLLPMPVFAQTRTFRSIVANVVDLITTAVMPLLFIFALAYFIWGVVLFIKNSDNQEKRKQGRTRILWGIIALFIMVSYLGITSIFTQSLFNRQPLLPQLYEQSN